MTVIKQGFCKKLTDECDSKLKMLEDADKTADVFLKSLKLGLSNVTNWSPHWAANKLKRDVDKNIDTMVPNLNDFDELVTLINACLYTKNDKMLSKPTVMARAITGQLKSNAAVILDSLATLAGTIIPEFSSAKLIDALRQQLKIGGFNIMVPEVTQVLRCMSAICGTNITSRAARLQILINKYSLNGSGEIDVNKLLESQNIHPDIIIHINTCLDQIDKVNNGITASVSAGVSRIKELVPDSDDE